ncbi:MAG: carboxypeptidase-like regulatory domain-containing protein [Cryomorphaceae bacterium]|nr:carboxypeptidase-like regulatory domain-containing protein [Cryomorphaceae bacterium]
MRQILLIPVLLFCSLWVNAQPGKNQTGDGVFSGRVVDLESNEAIEFVVVRLFSVKDSTVIAGIYTDEEGKFILENLPYGNFYALFTFTDFKPERVDDIKLSSTLKVANAGTIKLKLEVQQLGEVKASANLDVLKAGIDKKIYNVGEDLSVRGGTANDVLRTPKCFVRREWKDITRCVACRFN